MLPRLLPLADDLTIPALSPGSCKAEVKFYSCVTLFQFRFAVPPSNKALP
jgi:hypothetical protein